MHISCIYDLLRFVGIAQHSQALYKMPTFDITGRSEYDRHAAL